MKLALQPVRRNLRAKPALPNVSTCSQCASSDSAIGTFRTLFRNRRAVSVSLSRFFRYRSRDAKRHANKPFRMNTCESVSKQSTLNTFRINTCEKQGGGGPRFPRLQRPASSIQPPEPYAPRGASIRCGLSRLRILPVTTGVYESVWQLGLTLPLYWRERRSAGWPIFWSTTRSKLTCCHRQ